jgi:hypothetical protein
MWFRGDWQQVLEKKSAQRVLLDLRLLIKFTLKDHHRCSLGFAFFTGLLVLDSIQPPILSSIQSKA